MRKINLLEIIYSNLRASTIKDIIYNEAEQLGKEIFSRYERSVEIEDIKEDMRLYAEIQLRKLTDEITEDLISDYVDNMGNDEILEVLK
jgi:hypothetical protein